jgi:Rhodanese-like domain
MLNDNPFPISSDCEKEESDKISEFSLLETSITNHWGNKISLADSTGELPQFFTGLSVLNIDYNPEPPRLQASKSMFELTPNYFITEAQKNAKSISEIIYLNRKYDHIPTVPSDDFYELRMISAEALHNLIANKKSITLLDCRSNAEYIKGRITNAINITSPIELIDELFSTREHAINSMVKCATIVFYCMNSKEISPFLMRLARTVDRRIHYHSYPFLAYPQMMLLKGGIDGYNKAYKVKLYSGRPNRKLRDIR